MASSTFYAIQGSDTNLVITEVNSALTPIDISNATEIIFAIYRTATQDAHAILTKKLSTGEIILTNGGSDGKYEVPIADTDTPGIAPGDYEWQTRITRGGKERVCQTGMFTILAAGDFTVL